MPEVLEKQAIYSGSSQPRATSCTSTWIWSARSLRESKALPLQTKKIQNWKVLHKRFLEGSSSPKCKSHNSELVQGRWHLSAIEMVIDSTRFPESDALSREYWSYQTWMEEFFIEKMHWVELFETTISLERKAFSEGVFHEAYVANSISGLLRGQMEIVSIERQ